MRPAAGGPVIGPIPVMLPKLPEADELEPWLRKIDETRRYTNFGPLELLLRGRLGAMTGLAADQVGLFSTGTAALAVAIRTLAGGSPGICMMPAWTHVGTAAAVKAAGLEPFLVDCDPATWAIDPGVIERHANLDSVRAVVPVAPFGDRLDYAAWDQFSRASGIPVAIDAAGGFDQFVNFGGAIPWGRTPVMVSLHATKVFGVGEGGLLLSGDPGVIIQAQKLSNFGIYEDRPIGDAFGNYKISEYAAAVGLASLEGWPARRRALARLASEMRGRMEAVGVRTAPGFGGEFVTSTCMVSIPSLPTDELEGLLAAQGIGVRRWWREGLQSLPAFKDCGRDGLTATSELANSYLGVPFFADMTDEQVDRLLDVLARLATNDPAPLLSTAAVVDV